MAPPGLPKKGFVSLYPIDLCTHTLLPTAVLVRSDGNESLVYLKNRKTGAKMFDATPSDAFCVSQCVYIHPHLRKQTPRELGEKSLPTTRRPKKNPENINTLWNGMCIRSSVSCHDPP